MSQPTSPGQPNQPQGTPSGTPGQYPQPAAQPPQAPQPQQPPQQGYGSQPVAPGSPGYPQQQPQQSYPQPQTYPQQGYPQPGYPPAQGYGQQGQGYTSQPPGYGQQTQGYAPQGPGYPPQGYAPTGGQRPPGGKSSRTLIMIVIGVVALLAIVGGVFLAMSSNKSTPETPVTPTPVPTTQAPTPAPTPAETTPATPDPTPTSTPDQPTPAPTPAPAGSVQLTGGVVIPVAQGWQADQKSAAVVILTDGKAQVIAQTMQTDTKVEPGQICQQFHQSVLKDAANTKFGDSQAVNAPEVVKIASCMAMYTETQGGQSADVLLETFVSIRQTDASTLLFTIFSTDATPESSFTGINEMLNAALNSHIQSA